MEITAEQLRRNYASKETEELLDIRARNQLTDVARAVIEEELAARGVTGTIISAAMDRNAKEQTAINANLSNSNLAPRLSRLLAKTFDVLGVFAGITSINFLVFIYTPKTFSDSFGSASIILYLIYFLFKDAWDGQSLGKRLMRIKVIEKSSGKPCSAPKSFLRNILGVLGIFDWLFIFGDQRMRLGDIAADTAVVRK